MKSKKYRKYILGSLAAISIIGIVAGTCAGVCYKNTTKSNLDNKTNSGSITSKNDSNATNQNNRTTKNDHDSIKTQNSGTNPDKNDGEKSSTGSNNNPSSNNPNSHSEKYSSKSSGHLEPNDKTSPTHNPNSTHNKESNSSPDISHSSQSQPPVGPGPVVNPHKQAPKDLNGLNYDLNINDNEVSPSSNIINLNYLTNSFSLSNIEYSNHLVDVTNGNCSLTYVITNLSDNKVVTTKNITSTSNSNWSSFSYDFAPSITTSTQSYSIEVTLLLKNLFEKNNIIKTTVYDFKITNPLQLSTSYGEKGSLEQLFINDTSNLVGQTTNNTWIDFLNQYFFWYQLNANRSYFDDWKVYFSQMPTNDNLGTNEFLTFQATSTKPISVNWWNFGNWTIDEDITPIPIGKIFIWTLPYELAQLAYRNGTLEIPLLSITLWDDSAEPFGLKIGTSSNPTAISNDGQFNNIPNCDVSPTLTRGGIIQIYPSLQCGPDIPFSYTCPNNTQKSFNSNQTLNISGPELINFKNTATYAGQIVSSSNYPGTYAYSIVNKAADINVKNSGSLSGNSTLFNYYFDKPGEYEITITYVLNNVLGNTITNTELYYVNYQLNHTNTN